MGLFDDITLCPKYNHYFNIWDPLGYSLAYYGRTAMQKYIKIIILQLECQLHDIFDQKLVDMMKILFAPTFIIIATCGDP